jgi:regulator of protease activity HflC (stomatin/prohibitin superfamily)
VFAFLWNRIVITVNSGEAGVFYSRLFGGTEIDYVYPEGLYLILPWDNMTTYNARVQLMKHEFDVLTNKGLPIHVKIAVRFRPQYDLIAILHQQVGPDYVDKIIIPQIESVLRKNIGQYDPEDIYTNKQGILSKIIVLALEEIGRKYVQVDELIIRSLELPESVRKAIEDKLVNEQQYKAYEYKLAKEQEEAKRKRIEAKGIADYQEIVAQTLNEPLLRWQGIHATEELATSNNAKTVVIGAGKDGLPIILNER